MKCHTLPASIVVVKNVLTTDGRSSVKEQVASFPICPTWCKTALSQSQSLHLDSASSQIAGLNIAQFRAVLPRRSTRGTGAINNSTTVVHT